MYKEMHLVTVVNRNDPGLELWEHTAKLAGHTPTILRAPANSKLGHASKWFGQKFVTLDAHLATLPSTDLVLVTDGFDVVVLESPESLAYKIQSHIQPDQLLFAAEVYENPDKGNPYDTRHLPFPFLNSGVYAGRVETIRKALQDALRDPYVLQLDDQRYFTQQYFANRKLYVLDHRAKVFACMAGVDSFSIHNRKLILADSEPSVLHFQGFYKNTLGILPSLFPSDSSVAQWASQLHRQPNLLTPFGDFIADLGRPLPFGDTAPFATGIIVILCLVFAVVWDFRKQRTGNRYT